MFTSAAATGNNTSYMELPYFHSISCFYSGLVFFFHPPPPSFQQILKDSVLEEEKV